MSRYNMNDRPTPGGSCEERLAPKIGDKQLNARIGGIPRGIVRETSQSGPLREPNATARRRSIGLPSRFDKS